MKSVEPEPSPEDEDRTSCFQCQVYDHDTEHCPVVKLQHLQEDLDNTPEPSEHEFNQFWHLQQPDWMRPLMVTIWKLRFIQPQLDYLTEEHGNAVFSWLDFNVTAASLDAVKNVLERGITHSPVLTPNDVGKILAAEWSHIGLLQNDQDVFNTLTAAVHAHFSKFLADNSKVSFQKFKSEKLRKRRLSETVEDSSASKRQAVEEEPTKTGSDNPVQTEATQTEAIEESDPLPQVPASPTNNVITSSTNLTDPEPGPSSDQVRPSPDGDIISSSTSNLDLPFCPEESFHSVQLGVICHWSPNSALINIYSDVFQKIKSIPSSRLVRTEPSPDLVNQPVILLWDEVKMEFKHIILYSDWQLMKGCHVGSVWCERKKTTFMVSFKTEGRHERAILPHDRIMSESFNKDKIIIKCHFHARPRANPDNLFKHLATIAISDRLVLSLPKFINVEDKTDFDLALRFFSNHVNSTMDKARDVTLVKLDCSKLSVMAVMQKAMSFKSFTILKARYINRFDFDYKTLKHDDHTMVVFQPSCQECLVCHNKPDIDVKKIHKQALVEIRRIMSKIKSPKRVCKFFVLHNNCKEGDQCNFIHEMPGNVGVQCCLGFLRNECPSAGECAMPHLTFKDVQSIFVNRQKNPGRI